MTGIPSRPDEITESEWHLVELFLRYPVLTLDLVVVLRPGESRDTVRIRLERLYRRRWLAKTSLAGGQPCYALGPRAQRTFGLHYRGGFPFSTDGILEYMGLARFCVLASFDRLLPDEFHARFPAMHRRGLPAQRYCLDRERADSVCWLIVDHGSDVRRFSSKVANVVSARLPVEGFDELVRSGRFQIVIVTATPQKQQRIQSAIEEGQPVSVPVSVVAIPPLLQFLIV